jgi:hypothetical protein
MFLFWQVDQGRARRRTIRYVAQVLPPIVAARAEKDRFRMKNAWEGG